jgi:hypothetical protein
LAIVKDRLGDVLWTIRCEIIEGFQVKRELGGFSNRAVNTDVGVLRKVLKLYGPGGRLPRLRHDAECEAEGPPTGGALTPE